MSKEYYGPADESGALTLENLRRAAASIDAARKTDDELRQEEYAVAHTQAMLENEMRRANLR